MPRKPIMHYQCPECEVDVFITRANTRNPHRYCPICAENLKIVSALNEKELSQIRK